MTRAPRLVASWSTAEPTLPAPPFMKTDSPAAQLRFAQKPDRRCCCGVHHCYRFFFVRAIRQWVEESFVDGQIFGKCTLASVVALVVAPDAITRRESLHVATD